MPVIEVITLIGGAALLVAAILIVLMLRNQAKVTDPTPRPGLIEPEPGLVPPVGLRPGMLGALHDGEVSKRDIRLSLADLAARGYLELTTITDERGIASWQLRRTSKPADESLLGYERILIDDAFAAVGTHTPVALSALAAQPGKPLLRAEEALTSQLHEQQWLAAEPRAHHSPWGWVGALMLVAGLLVTGYMLIDWLARSDFRGVLGGLFIVAAGVLLASKGRQHSVQTEAGQAQRIGAQHFGQRLSQLKVEDIDPAKSAAQFGQLLVWAAAFGRTDHLTRLMDEALRRTANWGHPIELQLDWLTPGHPTTSAYQLGVELDAVVNRRTAGRVFGGRPMGSHR